MKHPALLGLFLAIVLGQSTTARFTSTLLSAEWPQFRGPSGQGHATAPNLPTQWSETSNIHWKVPIPGNGWSSPVVVDEEVWLTTATDEGKSLRAICVDLATGEPKQNVEVFRRDTTESKHTQNTFATPTPVIDGQFVYVHFGAGGSACLTRTGSIVWKRDDLTYDSPHGPANSPVVHDGKMIVCADGSDKQFVTAMDTRSGETVWQHDRQHLEEAHAKSKAEKDDSRKGLPFIAFSTPLVVGDGDDASLVCSAADHVVANRIRDGKEIWWHPFNCFSLVARPVTNNGLIFAIGGIRDGHYEMYAIRSGAKGKLSDEDLAWTTAENVPQIVSPIAVGNELYLFKRNGVASCLDAATGKVHWKQRIGGNYRASPIATSDRIYILNQEGKTTVLAADSTFRPLATNELEGIFLASPAVAGESLVIRSDKHLYRIMTK